MVFHHPATSLYSSLLGRAVRSYAPALQTNQILGSLLQLLRHGAGPFARSFDTGEQSPPLDFYDLLAIWSLGAKSSFPGTKSLHVREADHSFHIDVETRRRNACVPQK